MRTLSPLLAAALLVACSAPDRSLQAFSDCDEMDGYMRRMASRELRTGWSLGIARSDMALSAGGPMAAEESADSDGSVAGSYSGTNLQEVGVDEADLVKTDGEYLYAIAGDSLVITKAWPIAEAAVLGKIGVDGQPRGVFLLEGSTMAVVISDLWWGQQPQPLSGADAEWRDYAPSALATVIDLTDKANPTIVRETYTTGELKATRRIGDKLFVVTYEDISVTTDANTRREERVALYEAKSDAWQTRRLDNVLTARGDIEIPATWDVVEGPGCDCDETWYSDELGGTYVANALVLDLSDPLGDFEGTAVAGRADTVYMSPEGLYVAYTEANSGPFASLDNIQETVVHKFDVTGDAPAYAATGVVRGSLTDPFSLSEKDGILRMALTDWGTGGQDGITNGVYTLEQDGAELAPLDWVIGLAPGESITSARFVGDFGYISTWEVMLGDPLFTFDMTDPADIVLGGELAVTGWSDYLHPIDAGHLLAVGMETDGPQWGLAVSLYDVTDIANPRLAEREVLPAWGSESQSDHHAFNYFAPTSTLAIPSWANEGATVLEVLHADADGIEPIGRVVQDEDLLPIDAWCGGIRRSVILEDTVWAVSPAGMTAAKLDAPGTAIGTVAFEGVDPCYSGYDYTGGGEGDGDVGTTEPREI